MHIYFAIPIRSSFECYLWNKAVEMQWKERDIWWQIPTKMHGSVIESWKQEWFNLIWVVGSVLLEVVFPRQREHLKALYLINLSLI